MEDLGRARTKAGVGEGGRQCMPYVFLLAPRQGKSKLGQDTGWSKVTDETRKQPGILSERMCLAGDPCHPRPIPKATLLPLRSTGVTAGSPGRPVAPGTVGRRWAGLSSAGELPSLTGTVVAGILMLAAWGPAAALGICAFAVPHWHAGSILLQKPCGEAAD